MTGGCGCGAVRFEITEPFLSAALLPLHALPAAHGDGVVGERAGRARFGPDHGRRGRAPRLGAGGREEKVFCGLCGSALFSRRPRRDYMGVRLGAIDGDPGIRPQWHQYVAYAAAWQQLPDDGLPRYPESRPA